MVRGETPLFTYEADLLTGTYVDRPNRFTLRIAFDDRTERVYLRNSGGLETVLETGRRVLCRPVSNPDRATDYDAIAVRVDDRWVTVDATLPNTVFDACIGRELLRRFDGYRIAAREPALPEEGRTDFHLATPGGGDAYVEIKSCTYVVDGVSKFPDRPTERGRRHLRSLIALTEDGTECHVVFVVQRPDGDCLRPFREVDPEFADLLARASDVGVNVSARTTGFYPPDVYLHDPALPVELKTPDDKLSE